LFLDGQDRTDKVLVGAHAPCDSIHGYANISDAQVTYLLLILKAYSAAIPAVIPAPVIPAGVYPRVFL